MKKIFVLLVLMCSSSFFAQELPRVIDVNGTSEVIAQADYIYFIINIRNVAKTLEASRQNNITASDELVKIINKFQIAKDDWELSPIRFGKEYSFAKGERNFAGYYSQIGVTVKLRDLNNYYAFINELSKNELYEITRSDYGVTDFTKYRKEAVIKAVQAAKEKAGYIAENMGVKTGKIIQIKELERPEAFPNSYAVNAVAAAGSSQENISGKISVNASVNIKVELLD